MTERDLSGLFAPDRVAVVGATDREGSVGRALVESLATFDGDLLPVNPNRETVLGEPCYPSIADVPGGPVDLAVVVVPAPVVVDVVREAGEAGVENVVVVTAGFGETDAAGQRRERDLVAVAEEYDLNLVGPNCVGVAATGVGMDATFVRGSPPEGSVSLMSQSGAVVSAVFEWADESGVGFRDVVSLGNEAVLGEVDFLEYWGGDPETDVVLAYVEDIEEGGRFLAAAREATRETPVVVLKSGHTEEGAAAAASHTGSIAGSDRAYDAGFRQGGVYRAATVEEAFDACQALAGLPLPAGDGVGIVTNGGGPGVMAADAVDDARLSVADLSQAHEDLEGVVPETIAVGNPVDVAGDAGVDRFREALDAVLGAESVDSAVVISVPTALFEFDELAEVLVDARKRHDAPVVACLMGGESADRAAERLAEAGVPNYFDPARAVGALSALAEYREVRDREPAAPTTFDVDRERAHELLSTADPATGRLGVEGMDLLEAYGIPAPPGGLAESAAEAEQIAARVGGPVVLKVASPDLFHKSDFGGVALDVPVEDVRERYHAVLDRATDRDPEADLLGVRVERQVDTGAGTETLVGVNRDPQFGHLVVFGLGGIFVEVFEDTAGRIAPVTERSAREMTAEIRAAPMLRGARGRPPADLDSVVEAIQRVSQLVTEFPAIDELDVNPLVAGPDGATAVDLRLTVDLKALSPPE